jgi:hypothetical protein
MIQDGKPRGFAMGQTIPVRGMDRQTLRDWVIRFNEHPFSGSAAQAQLQAQGLSRPDPR